MQNTKRIKRSDSVLFQCIFSFFCLSWFWSFHIKRYSCRHPIPVFSGDTIFLQLPEPGPQWVRPVLLRVHLQHRPDVQLQRGKRPAPGQPGPDLLHPEGEVFLQVRKRRRTCVTVCVFAVRCYTVTLYMALNLSF